MAALRNPALTRRNFSLRTILDIVERAGPHVVGAAAYFFTIYLVSRWLAGQGRVVFRYAAVVATIALFFGCHRYVADHRRAADITKAMIAIVAAGCVFYEQHCAGQRRPLVERWKRFVGIALGVAGIIVCFNGFKFGYPRDYHRRDQSHYYTGAKYLLEMGHYGLCKRSVVAEDELGTISNDDAGAGLEGTFDLIKNVRHPDKKICNLGSDNLSSPVTDILAHPEESKGRSSPERWEKYRADVRFFRIASDKGYWGDMQKDHGFDPPPVWTILGHGFGDLHGATTGYLRAPRRARPRLSRGHVRGALLGLRVARARGRGRLLGLPVVAHQPHGAARPRRARRRERARLGADEVHEGRQARRSVPGLEDEAALIQLIWITFTYNDDKYTVLTLLSPVLCSGMIGAFAPRGSLSRLFGPRSGGAAPVTDAAFKRQIAEGDEE